MSQLRIHDYKKKYEHLKEEVRHIIARLGDKHKTKAKLEKFAPITTIINSEEQESENYQRKYFQLLLEVCKRTCLTSESGSLFGKQSTLRSHFLALLDKEIDLTTEFKNSETLRVAAIEQVSERLGLIAFENSKYEKHEASRKKPIDDLFTKLINIKIERAKEEQVENVIQEGNEEILGKPQRVRDLKIQFIKQEILPVMESRLELKDFVPPQAR